MGSERPVRHQVGRRGNPETLPWSPHCFHGVFTCVCVRERERKHSLPLTRALHLTDGAYVMSCALGQYGKDLGVAGAVCVSPAYDAHFVNKNMRNNPLAWPYGWFLIYRLMSLYEVRHAKSEGDE
jgi:hypothetical protein